MDSQAINYSGYRQLLAIESALPNYNKFIVTKIEALAQPHMQILDFGAGIGTLARLLKDHGFDPLCFEPDRGQCEIITQRGLRITTSLDNIPDKSLDVIYSSNVLEHIAEDEAQLALLARKLKPKGLLFLYLPAMMMLFSEMDISLGHYRRYGRGELIGKLRRAGLTLENSYYCDTIGFFATLGLKIMRAKSSTSSELALKFYDRILFPITCTIENVIRLPFGKNLVSISSLTDA